MYCNPPVMRLRYIVALPLHPLPRARPHTHVASLHTVVIVDPGLHNQTGYPPWDQGLKEDIYLKDKKGSVFIGKVWPGTTAFPDFLHPKTANFWEEQVNKRNGLSSEQCVFVCMYVHVYVHMYGGGGRRGREGTQREAEGRGENWRVEEEERGGMQGEEREGEGRGGEGK